MEKIKKKLDNKINRVLRGIDNEGRPRGYVRNTK
jgi:hypothetical protein